MALELLDGEGEEEVDAPAKLRDRSPERSKPLGARPGDGGGIRQSPVREHGLTRKPGARLLRPVADRDDDVPPLADHVVDRLRMAVMPPNALLGEHLDGER